MEFIQDRPKRLAAVKAMAYSLDGEKRKRVEEPPHIAIPFLQRSSSRNQKEVTYYTQNDIVASEEEEEELERVQVKRGIDYDIGTCRSLLQM